MQNDPKENQTKNDIETYRPRLFSFIRGKVPTLEDAEDLLQELYYRFLKADSLLNPVEQVSAWLYRAARNLITDLYRKKKEEPLEDEALGELGEILLGESTPENAYLRGLIWDRLEEALAKLPPEQSQAFVRTEIDGLSFNELAKETGVAVNTLISRKRYALQSLRLELETLYRALMEP